MDDHIIYIAKRTIFNALQTCDGANNKTFVGDVLCSVLNVLLLSVIEYFSGSMRSLDKTLRAGCKSPKNAARICLDIFYGCGISGKCQGNCRQHIAPVAKFAAQKAMKEMEESVKDLALTSASLSPLGSDSSSDESKIDCKTKPSRKKSLLRKK